MKFCNRSATPIAVLALLFVAFALPTFAIADDAPMVTVSGGSFKSGPKLESVDVKEFSIDVYEVTFTRYHAIDNTMEIPAGKENHPVVEVSHDEATAYCKAVGKRLPTAIEWEKAARGLEGNVYPWGNDFVGANANTIESERNGTVPVGSIKAGVSPFGLYDMAGNVWEWVDAWETSEKRYRLAFGGSFFDDEDRAKAYKNIKSIPDDSHTYIGFRCAK